MVSLWYKNTIRAMLTGESTLELGNNIYIYDCDDFIFLYKVALHIYTNDNSTGVVK